MKLALKKTAIIFFVILLSIGMASANPFGEGRLSLKDLKKELKKDSSDKHNAELAEAVRSRGVSFQYTQKRQNELRKWGANDVLVAAVYQSINDERQEELIFNRFKENFRSKDRDTRRAALEDGRMYLTKFKNYERFQGNVSRVEKDLRFLECEFDPSMQC